jgi:hypothetical protein
LEQHVNHVLEQHVNHVLEQHVNHVLEQHVNHVNDVLDQLDLNGSRFEELGKELEGVLKLVGYFNAYYPGLVIERELVQRLARYSLSVDFDFYGFADGGEGG